ncbi:MAG: COG1615 family transporter, partial [Clostridiales bacterium]|nr:COG1615 family transporter [Clostridiales bacterium]
LFKDFEEMPEELRKHIRYPNMLFTIQAGIYTKYHMNDVEVFYQSEDRWEVSQEIYGIEPQSMTPNYYIMKMPGETNEEFINSIPYTPYGKKNMTGLLIARNDGENYGELVLFRLPKSKIVYGPMQIEGFIDQQTDISKEFSLWNSAGSSYTRGNMFVIPIEDSLVYVEPIYLEATNSSLPEVKRVIIYYNDRIAYEPTLAQALDTMFGAGSGSPLNGDDEEPGTETPGGTPGESVSDTDALIRSAVEAYNNAVAAQERGDWAAYGAYLNELESYLNKLNTGSSASQVVTPDEELDGGEGLLEEPPVE